MNRFLRNSVVIAFCVMASSCATPSSPTGGPQDTQGPQIISSEPETGTVNFNGNEIELRFSEFVKRSSLTKALVIEPQVGLKYNLDWGRKSVAIKFNNDIPKFTTLIVTIGTDFADLHGNSMGSPYKVAVSTGPEIDKGKLIGRILDGRTGESNEAKRVLLYRSPADLSQPANYIGETDTSGVVHFSYLREGKYKAFYVDDRNRNKIWDAQRERAQPFEDEFISLKKAGADTLGTLFIANSDTSKPALQGVGLFSTRRMRLRFSENIVITDSTRLQVQDSAGTTYSGVYPLYVSPEEKYVMFARSNKPLPADRGFQLNARNITDPAGNMQPSSLVSFTGSAQKDTTVQRIIKTSVDEGIFPDQPVEIIYATPVTKASLRDSLKVVEGDSLHRGWEHLEIQQNKLRILPDGSWNEGVDYEFRIWNPIVQDYKIIKPTIWHEADLGSLHIVFEDSTGKAATRNTHLALKTAQGRAVLDTTFVKEITIGHLAPVDHQLTLYQDLNNNGAWDFGTVDPFEAPEPYFIRNNIPIQNSLTADLAVSFETQ